MPDLIAVAAYGKTQSLTDPECVELFNRVSQLRWEPTLTLLNAVIADLKAERLTGLRDTHQPVMTHEQWQQQRKDQA